MIIESLPDKIECPMCDNRCILTPSPRFSAHQCSECRFARILIIEDDILRLEGKEAECAYNVIFEDAIRHSSDEKTDRHYIKGSDAEPVHTKDGILNTINITPLLADLPKWMLDRYDRVLVNAYYLYRGLQITKYGPGSINQSRMCLCDGSIQFEDEYILNSMLELGYFSRPRGSMFFTQFAWERLSELIQKNEGSKWAFIALGYTDTEKIRQTIKDAIVDAGYIPKIMDETQHNNQIVPEMFDYIKRCRFLVMDMTYPNYGAYYEAGLARGMGKQTILTCRSIEMHSENKSKKPHFDVAQQSTVVWDDFEDLRIKLAERIRMTID